MFRLVPCDRKLHKVNCYVDLFEIRKTSQEVKGPVEGNIEKSREVGRVQPDKVY